MERVISLLVVFSLFSSLGYADCDYSKIVKNNDGTYTYSPSLNLCVGQLVQDDNTKTQQVKDLNQAVTLKDLAITKSDARAENWMNTSLKLEQNIQKENTLKRDNEWLFFGLGVLATGLATFGAAQLGRTR